MWLFLEWVLGKNKTPDCEFRCLARVIYSFIISVDNQFDSGFAIRRVFI